MTEPVPPAFPLRRYDVDVGRWGAARILAPSRGKALAYAWQSDVFEGYSFSEFLRMAKCRLSDNQPQPDLITVSGEQCWGLGHNGQYVQLVRFGGDQVLHSHPLDVLPVSYRPKAYQPKDQQP